MLPDHFRKFAARFSLVLALTGLAGCATPPPADDPEAVAQFKENNDPFEPANRVIFDANDVFYTYFMHPVADGYRYVVPAFGRQAISNVLGNLKAPTVFFNDVLQGNFPRAGQVLVRVVLNSSFGVGGIMDVASPMGIPRHDADFGQTLAVWGVGEGPYIVLPGFGPSNPRDGVGILVDSFADPFDDYLQVEGLTWISEVRFGVSVLSLYESNMDALDDVKRSSLDYYSSMRSLSRQRRTAQINDATAPTIGWAHFMPHLTSNYLGIF